MSNPIPIPSWYSSLQAILCFFGSILFFALWLREAKRRENKDGDEPKREPALIYLGMAILVWAILGLWLALSDSPTIDSVRLERTLSSTLNSALFLLAIAYFDYGPTTLKIFQRNWRWQIFVLASALVIAIITYWKETSVYDVGFSILTLLVLGTSLFKSFRNREFYALAYLSWSAILLTLIPQILELNTHLMGTLISLTGSFDSNWQWGFLLISKAVLMQLFLALGYSWAFQVIELPQTKEMRLGFLEKRKVVLTVPGHYTGQKFELSPALHKVLLRFAVRRKCEESSGGGWIKITDKRQALYYTDLKRLCEKLGDIKLPSLFENDYAGRYRLRITAENVEIDKNKFEDHPELLQILSAL